MTHVLVTGASGFVGKALCLEAMARGLQVRAVVRHLPEQKQSDLEYIHLSDISTPGLDWTLTLDGIDTVFHLAGRAHVMKETAADSLAVFCQINVAATINLALQAAKAGVRRFIYVSSIKVNGEESEPSHPFQADDAPAPADAYSISKWEAEQALQKIAEETGLELVIIRPPLIYGPGVKANFRTLLTNLQRSIPLPLGAITHNQRSLVSLPNLVDFLLLCGTHPAAAGQRFLVSDGEDVSTAQLLHRISRILGKPAHLLPVPVPWLLGIASLLGKASIMRRLCGNLQVDISKNKKLLDWEPRITLDNGLRHCIDDFLKRKDE